MKKVENKDILLKYLASMYHKYEIAEDEGYYVNDNFRLDMQIILKKLPGVLSEIIENDFLCVKDENWWKNKYDEKTYLELKNIAVKAFFHCLYV